MKKTIAMIGFGILICFSACEKADKKIEQGEKTAKEAISEVKSEVVAITDSRDSQTDNKENKDVSKEAEILDQYVDADVEMVLKQVSEHAWYVEGMAGMATDNAGFISNAGVVITDDGAVIFDALGTPSLAKKLVQLIREKTRQPIKKVIVSHYHADHVYGLQVFKELGAEIITPEGALEYINAEIADERLNERRESLSPWVNEHTRLVEADRYLDKSERFSLGGVDFLISVVGSAHSEGDLTLYVETDKVLYTGDIIFEGRIPFLGSNNTRHWLSTLESLELAGVSALVPGHGPAANNPAEAIKLTRKYLAFMRQEMGRGVEEMLDFDEVYDEVDWGDFEYLPAFPDANRRNAFQVYLGMEQE